MGSIFTLDRFDEPVYLWLALVVVALWYLARRSLAGLGPIRGKLAMIARGCVIVLLVLALAGANKILESEDLNVLFVLDQSRSISSDLRNNAEAFIVEATRDMRKDDRASLLTFDGQTSILQLPSRKGVDGGIHIARPFSDGQKPDATNISQALRMAQACTLDSTNNRIVLLSDGNQNIGDVLEEAKTAQANGIPVDIVPLRTERGAEVIVESLRAPAYANLHQNVGLRLILSSDRPTSGVIRLHKRVGKKDELIDLDPDSEAYGRRVQLTAGRNALYTRIRIDEERSHAWRAEFIPDDPTADVRSENNEACSFTNIEGPQMVLFVGSEDQEEGDNLLIEALAKERINVERQFVGLDAVEFDTSMLQDYSAIILANIGANNFSAEQQAALATYVRDFGGGLIMIGGDDSFGAGGWQGSVVESIMPVRFDVDAIRQIPRGALAIVMHSCEMPDGNKWGVETAVAALETISRLDYFGVVGWGMNGYAWEVPMRTADDKQAIMSRLRGMQNNDMPDFNAPMKMALDALVACKDAAQRHMIIISDGDPAAPSPGLINQFIGNRITCSTVSIFPHGGMEIQTLRNIATQLKGQYYSLSRPGDEKRLPKIFIKEAKVVRRPLLRDEEFMPKVRSTLSDIMQGIPDELPMLRGYVVTSPRKVADVEMPLVTKRGDPLLAHWQCGAGRTVAFTSGEWRRWGAEWPGWPSYSKLWAQTVRWCMQQGAAADYEVRTNVEGDEGHIVIECMDDEESFANFKRFQGSVIQPDGTAIAMPVVQTGPGRYEATFKADQRGTYLPIVRSLGDTADDKPVVIRTGVTIAYSPEFRDLVTNEPLLLRVADDTEGRVLSFNTDSETVYAHNMPPTITRTPVWETLLKLAIIAFLMDIAIRRIAIDPIRILATTRAYIGSLAGRFGAGKRAEATLTDLKSVRDRVRSERTTQGGGGDIPAATTIPASEEAGPAATTKFETTSAPGKPAKDLVDALGGHKTSGEPKPATDKKKKEGEQESTTARLLKAKRRAREQDTQDDKP